MRHLSLVWSDAVCVHTLTHLIVSRKRLTTLIALCATLLSQAWVADVVPFCAADFGGVVALTVTEEVEYGRHAR